MRIDTIEKWEEVSQKMVDHKYRLWQMQYGINCPEGFIARFHSPEGLKDVEIVTFDRAVYNAIRKYNTRLE